MSRAGQFKIKWVSSLERFKNRILSNIPDLKAYKKGRHASLAFDEDVEIALKIVSENSVMAKPIF